MVVGDVLEYIYSEKDGSIAFRYECRTRQCGSCVIQVDGLPALFCATPVGRRNRITLEPLESLPVVRDLVTDRSALLSPLYRWPRPARVAELSELSELSELAARERVRHVPLESVSASKIAEECAECLLCTAVCPAFETSLFAGPMHFNKLALRATTEPGDTFAKEAALNLAITDCKTCFRCEDVCPHEIPIRRFSIASLLPWAR